MRRIITAALFTTVLFAGLPGALAQTSGAKSDSLVIVFKDGHRQSVPLANIERLEFPAAVPAGLISTPGPSRAHLLGKWEVGDGQGSNFFITLNDDGTALRTMGMQHEKGSWVYTHGEAQITWDDGPQDAIRKVGSWYKKYAYAQGKTFADEPDNVTNARNITQNPNGVD